MSKPKISVAVASHNARSSIEACLSALVAQQREAGAEIVVVDNSTDGTTEIIGRITSSRMSPTLERSICLGQLAADAARPGAEVTVVLIDGRRIKARVMEHHAHFDPEGERLRG